MRHLSRAIAFIVIGTITVTLFLDGMIRRRLIHGVDLRKTGVVFVHYGGDPAEAARRFDVSLWCVRDWRARKDLRPGSGVFHASGSRTWTDGEHRCVITRLRPCGSRLRIAGWIAVGDPIPTGLNHR